MRNIYINPYKKNLEPGDHAMIHAYKYNGWLYRIWTDVFVICELDEWLVLSSKGSTVLSGEENSKRSFKSKIDKTTYWFLSKKNWFNIIATIDKLGIKLYINIASPYLYEEGAIKYYDFDVDFKYHIHREWYELDIEEFEYNSKKFNYPNELIEVINDVRNDIKDKFNNNWFDQFIDINKITKIYHNYTNLKRKEYEKNTKDKKSTEY